MAKAVEYTSSPPDREAEDDTDLRARVLLSLQRALVGEVPPALRGVTVDWNGSTIDILCYFDGPLAEEDEESLRCVRTEVVADFPEGVTVNLRPVRRDAPNPMQPLRAWAYRRREQEHVPDRGVPSGLSIR